MLNKKGYVFLKNVIKKEQINNINSSINNFLKKEYIYTKVSASCDYNEKEYYVNNKYYLLNSYNKIQYYRVPVINVGGNLDTKTDVGLITIFNVNKIIHELKDINTTLLRTLLFKLTNIKWKLQKVNLKLLNNVLNPSKIHVDNYETCVKCCIYLNDIPTVDSGSNIFVEGSHINQRISHNRKNVKFITGEKGDILFSFQNGHHARNPNYGSVVGYLTYYFIPINNIYSNFDKYVRKFNKTNNLLI